MKINKKNIITDSISYLKIFLKESEKFNEFLHIGQATDSPLKVSYIKKEKIKSLKDFADIEIKKYPDREQRNKYFTSTSIEKLFNELFEAKVYKESQLLEQVTDRIDNHLKNNIKNDLFIEKDVSGFYSQELKKYDYYRNGSCMAGKPKAYFEIYDLINKSEHLDVKIVGIKSDKTVIARALLFCKTSTDKTNTRKVYFLDRIYVADFLQNSSYEELQTKLFNQIKRAYRIKNLNCYNKVQIQDHVKQLYRDNNKAIIKSEKQKPSFYLNICPHDAADLEYYPYADTFKYIADKGITCLDEQQGHILTLDCTSGDATDVNGSQCMECGENCDEDDIRFSDLEDDYICDDCSVYIDERDDCCSPSNATYNSFSQTYHYSDDLDR